MGDEELLTQRVQRKESKGRKEFRFADLRLASHILISRIITRTLIIFISFGALTELNTKLT